MNTVFYWLHASPRDNTDAASNNGDIDGLMDVASLVEILHAVVMKYFFLTEKMYFLAI